MIDSISGDNISLTLLLYNYGYSIIELSSYYFADDYKNVDIILLAVKLFIDILLYFGEDISSLV